jgi:DNA primase
MLYPQTFIDDLRRQADIVRVVQDYVTLKKKGANWMACCPFHKEKTPSFSVSPTKEIFYCFGCHKGGSVFNFVMEMERVSFPEAIKIVAEKTGVPLPKMVEDSRFEARRSEIDDVIQLNRWALEWWEAQLLENEGKVARGYLEQREITRETQETFHIGYAPDSWEALTSHLKAKGASEFQIQRSGLVATKDESRWYDRFRARLMFPVLDVQGRPIAFGGRALKPDDNAKYINSPETAAYIKGRHLFGLNLTRDEIRRAEYAVLVEGFLDLIVPYQFGIRNVAASLGTALTPEQAKLLGRFARKVVVNYDGDQAGLKAAKRAIEILLAEEFEVKVLVLPDNSDPDEFIRKSGAIEYQRRRGQAQPHIQFVIDQAVRDRKLSNPADKEAAIEEVLPYVRAVRSRIQKREYFDTAMDALRIGDVTLKRELWHSIRSGIEGAPKLKVFRQSFVKPTVAEQRLLELLFADAEVRHAVLPRLQPDDYQELPTGRLFQILFDFEAIGQELSFENISPLIEADTAAAEILPLLLMVEISEGSFEERITTADRCISALRLMQVHRSIDEVKLALADAQRVNDEDEVAHLSMRQIELERLKTALLPVAEVFEIAQ